MSVTHDFGLSVTYTYDPVSGLLIEKRTVSAGADLTTTYSYDAAGALVEELLLGDYPTRTTYAQGPCGPVQIWLDDQDDAVVDQITSLSYTPASSTADQDVDADGIFDRQTVTERDVLLGRTDRVSVEEDPAHPGFELVSEHSYDAAGYLQTLQTAYRSLTVRISTTQYSYDAEGRLLEMVEDFEGEIERTTVAWACP